MFLQDAKNEENLAFAANSCNRPCGDGPFVHRIYISEWPTPSQARTVVGLIKFLFVPFSLLFVSFLLQYLLFR